MTPVKYNAKASHAAKSARILLLAGDHEGACNRAFYAMFNAAHAALLWSGAHVNSVETKKHSSLIAAFGKHLVLTGLLPRSLGKALSKAENVRILAEYTGEDIEPEKAAEIVEQAALFVTTVENKFASAAPSAKSKKSSFEP